MRSGNTITFTSPTGRSLFGGDNLFATVVFTGAPNANNTFSFTGGWLALIPEPTPVLLFGALSIGLCAVRAWRPRHRRTIA